MVLSSVSYAFAEANPNNNGNAEDAPGQVNADANCGNAIDKQEEQKDKKAWRLVEVQRRGRVWHP